MAYLLVVWVAAYPFNSTVTMQRLDSKEQCEAIAAHLQTESSNVRAAECLPLRQ